MGRAASRAASEASSDVANISIPTESVQVIVHRKDGWSIALEIGGLLAVTGFTLWGFNWIMKRNNPASKEETAAQDRIRRFMRNYRFDGRKLPSLDLYECMLLDSIQSPDSIDVSFKDIGGHEDTVNAIFEAVILPLRRPELFNVVGSGNPRRLLGAPKGILLYGPPGTGKSMMAKAIARDAGATFINVDVSSLMSKWVGDSEKYVNALFTLANKLAPSIIFLDEIDGFLGARTEGGDHWVRSNVRTLFMTLWDGLATDESARVIVIGATNRPADLDPAILRRLPRTFRFDLPDANTRKIILRLLLRDEPLDADVDVDALAGKAVGYSGSDLKEMCKVAALAPITEYVREESKLHQAVTDNPAALFDAEQPKRASAPRAIAMRDLVDAMKRVRPTGYVARMATMTALPPS